MWNLFFVFYPPLAWIYWKKSSPGHFSRPPQLFPLDFLQLFPFGLIILILIPLLLLKIFLNDILTSSQAVSNMPVDQMLHLRIDCPMNNVAMVITPPAESDLNLENKSLEQPVVGSLSRIYRLTP